jgi:hypothetical protein
VGALGLKVEEGDCDMIVKNVVQGKGADMSGLRAGDHIISATVEGTKGGFISSMHWNESMPAHELYKVLMSKRRPMFMKASRKWSGDDASDDRAFEGKRQRAMDEYDVLEPVTKKKRGRPSLNKVKIDHEELTRQEVNQLGQWRENILRANELRLAATEIDMHNFPSSGISGKGATDAGAIHSTMGSFAVQSLKSHIQSLREEAKELWTNPRHTSWENSLKEYIAFKKEYGHGKMTKEMREKGDLFDWALRMREKYRNLNREGKTLRNKLMRIMEYAILCKVGFDFESTNGNWDYMFGKMLEYKTAHGTYIPPRRTSKQDKDTQKLADWVVHQRAKYREKHDPDRPNRTGVLTDEQEKHLTGVGFVWMEKLQWEDHYEALTQWVASHGHAKIPKVYPENQPLSSFVHTNRRYRMWQLEGKDRAKKAWRRLSVERIQLLDDIGFIWDTNGTSLITRKTPRSRKSRGTSNDENGADEENNTEVDGEINADVNGESNAVIHPTTGGHEIPTEEQDRAVPQPVQDASIPEPVAEQNIAYGDPPTLDAHVTLEISPVAAAYYSTEM